jgi:hypothetical protein
MLKVTYDIVYYGLRLALAQPYDIVGRSYNIVGKTNDVATTYNIIGSTSYVTS